VIQGAGALKKISVLAVSHVSFTSIQIQRRASVSTVDTIRTRMGVMFALGVLNLISCKTLA
jgi:hypothetical protein